MSPTTGWRNKRLSYCRESAMCPGRSLCLDFNRTPIRIPTLTLTLTLTSTSPRLGYRLVCMALKTEHWPLIVK